MTRYHAMTLKSGGAVLIPPGLLGSTSIRVRPDGTIEGADQTHAATAAQVARNIRAMRSAGIDPLKEMYVLHTRSRRPYTPNADGQWVCHAQWDAVSGDITMYRGDAPRNEYSVRDADLNVHLLQGERVGMDCAGKPVLGKIDVAVRLTSTYPHRMS